MRNRPTVNALRILGGIVLGNSKGIRISYPDLVSTIAPWLLTVGNEVREESG
jgi:hypothetical protein